MGKSSAIQSLLLLRQSYHRDQSLSELFLNGDLVRIGSGKDAYHEFAKEGSIEFELIFKSGLEARLHYWAAKPLDSIDEGQKLLHGVEDAGVLPQKFASVNNPTLEHLKNFYPYPPDPSFFFAMEKSLFGDLFRYLPADRTSPKVSFPVSPSGTKNYSDFGWGGEYACHWLHDHADDILSIDTLQHPTVKRDDKTLLSNMRAWLGEISPGITIETTLHHSLDAVELAYRYQTKGDVVSTSNMRPTNVGFGITFVLPVILSILQARPGDLLLIENPESHLHPRGQSQMGKLMAIASEAGVQIIVETHSDHVLNGVRLAVRQKFLRSEEVTLSFFSRGEDVEDPHSSVVIHPTVDRFGKLSAWPPDFFDEWDKAVFELI